PAPETDSVPPASRPGDAGRGATPRADQTLTVDLGRGVTMEFVRVEAGTFLMGAPDGEKGAGANERPRHEVRISMPLYLGTYLVTQEQYKAVTDQNPSWFAATGEGADKVRGLD